MNSGLQSVSSSLKIVGPIIAKDTDNDDNIDEIVFVMVINLDGEGINLTVPPNNTTVVALHTASQTSDDLSWIKTAIGKDDGDVTLEAGELAELTVDVSGLSPRLTPSSSFTMEVKPKVGSSLVFERTISANVDKVNKLR